MQDMDENLNFDRGLDLLRDDDNDLLFNDAEAKLVGEETGEPQGHSTAQETDMGGVIV